MSWRKEKKEHPWASARTAKRIAKDHAKQKPKPRRKASSKLIGVEAASRDFSGLLEGSKRITYQRR